MYHGWVPLSEHILLIELGIILHSDLFGHNVKFQSDVCNTGHTALVLCDVLDISANITYKFVFRTISSAR